MMMICLHVVIYNVLSHPQECISDEKPKNLTLSDLGVRLTYLEDRWPHDLACWRYNFGYDGDLGEKKLFTNPKFIVE